MKIRLVFALVTTLVVSILFAQFSDDEGSEEELIQIEDYSFFLSSAKWVGWDDPGIQVCWEDIDETYVEQMSIVKESVEGSWEYYSQIDFVGWEKCPEENFIGIRIEVADKHPHVKALGSYISGVKNGMVLNFDFNVEGFTICNEDPTMYDLCIRSIAVHEFGHALGFAHEHNREDREGSCFAPPQGVSGDTHLTPYDPDSVMNYCNPKYNNYGKLSYGDVIGVQATYGFPDN